MQITIIIITSRQDKAYNQNPTFCLTGPHLRELEWKTKSGGQPSPLTQFHYLCTLPRPQEPLPGEVVQQLWEAPVLERRAPASVSETDGN